MTDVPKMDEWMRGYFDGRDLDCLEPGPNHDPRYIHSFRVGRAERAGRPIPAEVSRRRAQWIEAMIDQDQS